MNGRSRVASQVAFVPIGHISLDSKNKDADRVGLDIPSEGVFWIKSFFISQKIQGQGLGRAAMDAVEDMATREPLCAQTLMLDTVTSEHQQREDFAVSTYGAVPKVSTQITLELVSKADGSRSQTKIGMAVGDTCPSRPCRTIMMCGMRMETGGISKSFSCARIFNEHRHRSARKSLNKGKNYGVGKQLCLSRTVQR